MLITLLSRRSRNELIIPELYEMANKRDLLNLESIIMLREVSRTKSKRGAAEVLGSSVDTVSKYIENLEKELGVSLIANNGRGCEMTIQGQKVLDHAALILDCLDDVYRIKPEASCPSGEVRIGMTNGISLNLQSHDIDEFYDAYPGLKLFSFSMPDVPNLKLNSFDIGITYKNPESDELILIYSKEVECGFFAAPKFLQKYGYPVDENDMLENFRMINKIDPINCIKWWKDNSKKAKHIVYSANTSYSVLRVVNNGLGIGIMPLRFKNEGLVCLDNIKCDTRVTYYLLAQRNTYTQPRIRVCLDYYKTLLDRI